MKSKTSGWHHFGLCKEVMIAIIITTAGCHLERKDVFSPGDRVVVTSFNATGTVVQAELGLNLDRECVPNVMYYQIRFGPVTNVVEEDVVWVPGQILKRVVEPYAPTN